MLGDVHEIPTLVWAGMAQVFIKRHRCKCRRFFRIAPWGGWDGLEYIKGGVNVPGSVARHVLVVGSERPVKAYEPDPKRFYQCGRWCQCEENFAPGSWL